MKSAFEFGEHETYPHCQPRPSSAEANRARLQDEVSPLPSGTVDDVEADLPRIARRITNGQKWDGYRLGDMIKSEKQRQNEHGERFHCRSFPDSFACKFIDQLPVQLRVTTGKQEHDSSDASYYGPVLSKLVADGYAEHSEWERAGNDTLVVHLRLGDMLEASRHSPRHIVSHGGKSKLAKGHTRLELAPLTAVRQKADTQSQSQLLGWQDIAKCADAVGATSIMLVGACHYGTKVNQNSKKLRQLSREAQSAAASSARNQVRSEQHQLMADPTKSAKYVALLRNSLRAATKLPVMILPSSSPDEQFAFMASAKHFMKSVGGFSTIIETLVEQRGNSACRAGLS